MDDFHDWEFGPAFTFDEVLDTDNLGTSTFSANRPYVHDQRRMTLQRSESSGVTSGMQALALASTTASVPMHQISPPSPSTIASVSQAQSAASSAAPSRGNSSQEEDEPSA